MFTEKLGFVSKRAICRVNAYLLADSWSLGEHNPWATIGGRWWMNLSTNTSSSGFDSNWCNFGRHINPYKSHSDLLHNPHFFRGCLQVLRVRENPSGHTLDLFVPPHRAHRKEHVHIRIAALLFLPKSTTVATRREATLSFHCRAEAVIIIIISSSTQTHTL